MSALQAPGRITTFYSYKGGTGRSMALANLAWILASNGRRVLAIDWDLEAPGLHRYFRPFLADPELASSPGVIEFALALATASRRAGHEKKEAAGSWYEDAPSILRYTVPLVWPFPEGGCIDFVPAGRQDASYATRVTGFDWPSFYERMGGGVVFEAVKRELRMEYDDILIDSRTGISDTSGICTVQLPDDLVVMFTLNRQSIAGAAAVAESAFEQRRLPNGAPGLRVWPVPTRIDGFEKERLLAALDHAYAAFRKFVGRLPRAERPSYWNGVQIFYQPYFSYEEVLAIFAERKHQTASMLMSLENLARRLTDGAVEGLIEMPEPQRLEGLGRFASRAEAAGGGAFVLLVTDSTEAAWRESLLAAIRDAGARTIAPADVQTGNWAGEIEDQVSKADIVLAIIDKGVEAKGPSKLMLYTLALAQQRDAYIVPVLVDGLGLSALHHLPAECNFLSELQAVSLDTRNPKRGGGLLTQLMRDAIRSDTKDGSPTEGFYPDDPQKGRWGMKSEVNGLEVRGTVSEISPDWFGIKLEVMPVGPRTLEGPVQFHLHPTFAPDVQSVVASGGRATLNLQAWGAFTVGVAADWGKTRLELDLASLADAPPLFRTR